MRRKTKEQALRIIHKCALAYKDNLAHKNLMFVTLRDSTATHFEVVFLPSNFLHLTGVKSNLNGLDFYNLSVKDRLSERDIRITDDGTTDLKLDVLPQLMNIHVSARMVGDYDYSKSLLVTDKLAGTVTAAMGFRKTDENAVFVPNTALNTDMRLISIKPIQRIAAIFQKKKQEEKYNILTYIAKGLTVYDNALATVLREKVDEQNLTATFLIPRKSQ